MRKIFKYGMIILALAMPFTTVLAKVVDIVFDSNTARFSVIRLDDTGVTVAVAAKYGARPPSTPVPGAMLFRKHLGGGEDKAWSEVILTRDIDFGNPVLPAESALGTIWEPRRYEKRYFSTTLPAGFDAFVNSPSQYEWMFVRKSFGAYIKISDIQDPWRAQDFSDTNAFILQDATTGQVEGRFAKWLFSSSGGQKETSTVGKLKDSSVTASSYQTVALIGNATGAYVESPVYEDGTRGVEFEIKRQVNYPGNELTDHSMTLIVEYSTDHIGDSWTSAYRCRADLPWTTYSVTFPVTAMRIRWKREKVATGTSGPLEIALTRVRVLSRAPGVGFSFKEGASPFRPDYPMVNNDPVNDDSPLGKKEFHNRILLTDRKTGTPVGGYEMNLAVIKKVTGPIDNPVYYQRLIKTATAGDVTTLESTITISASTAVADGATLVDDAYYLMDREDPETLVGLKQGLYSYTFEGAVLGAYRAGRDAIEEREAVTISFTPEVSNPETATEFEKRFTLELREKKTQNERVTLKTVMSSHVPNEDGTATILQSKYVDIQMMPSGEADYLWHAVIPCQYRDEQGLYFSYNVNNPYDVSTEASKDESATLKDVLGFYIETTNPYATNGTERISLLGVYSDPELISPEVTPFGGQIGVTWRDAGKDIPVGDYSNMIVADLRDCATGDLVIEYNTDTKDYVIFRSAYQSFNTWTTPSFDFFTQGENIVGQKSFPASFDITEYVLDDATKARVAIDVGWYPDVGPFALGNTVNETFRFKESGSTDVSEDQKFDKDLFSPRWGIIAPPEGQWIFNDLDGDVDSFVIQLGGSSVLDGAAVIDGAGGGVGPTSTATLNGVGGVRFDAAAFMPFDLSKRAYAFWGMQNNVIKEADSGFTAIRARVNGCGGSKVSSSGNAVSLFLGAAYDNTLYEYRVSRVWQRDDLEELKEVLVSEIYFWGNTGVGTSLARSEKHDPNISLNGKTLTFFIEPKSGSLRGSVHFDGSFLTALDLSVGRTLGANNVAVQCAYSATGCNAQLTDVNFAQEYVTVEGSDSTTKITASWLFFSHMLNGIGSNPWDIKMEDVSGVTSMTRNSDITKIVVEKKIGDKGKEKWVAVDRSLGSAVVTVLNISQGAHEYQFDVNEGGGDIPIRIRTIEGSAVIDNVSISSWRGNDEQKNGPNFTDANKTQGYSAIGIWVEPTDAREVSFSKDQYSGLQQMLMQYSRRDSSRADGDSACLISPHSEKGFGPIYFSYKINAQGKELGKFVLQYLPGAKSPSFFDFMPGGWKDASEPFYLDGTNGEWQTMSKTPLLQVDDEGEFITLLRGEGYRGYLRLSMIKNDLDKNNVDTPVYFDNVLMSDFPGVDADEWSMSNGRIRATPLEDLYWKDRTNTEDGRANYTIPFADKTYLTRSITLNSSASNDVYGGIELRESYVRSPILDNGVGKVFFGARVDEFSEYLNESSESLKAEGVYLHLQGTESDSTGGNVVWDNLKRWEVSSQDFDVYTCNVPDLAKVDEHWQVVTDDSRGYVGLDQAKKYRRVRLFVNIEGGSSTLETDELAHMGRVSIDRLLVQDPVGPSLRVAEVLFTMEEIDITDLQKNLPSLRDPKTATQLQPIQGTKLWVWVKLDRKLLDPQIDHVYLSYRVDPLTEKEFDFTAVDGQKYTNRIWDSDNLPWDQSEWCDLTDAPPNRIELFSVKGSEYWSTEDQLPLPDLKRFIGSSDVATEVNDIVRYNVWVEYRAAPIASDTPDAPDAPTTKYITQINEEDFKCLPWYYPRDLNFENNKPNELTNFSPYFWLYSVAPGEVFFNEINLRDNSGFDDEWAQFIELCVPISVDFKDWEVREYTQLFELAPGGGFTIGATYGTGADAEPSATIVNDGVISQVADVNGNITEDDTIETRRGFYLAVGSNFGNNIVIPAYPDGTTTPPTNPIKPQLRKSSVLENDDNSTTSGILKIYRDNGAYEGGICYGRSEAKGTLSAPANTSMRNINRVLDADRKQKEGANAWFTLTYAGWDDGATPWKGMDLSFGTRYMGKTPYGAAKVSNSNEPDPRSWVNYQNAINDTTGARENKTLTPGGLNHNQTLLKYEGVSYHYVKSTVEGGWMKQEITLLSNGSSQDGGTDTRTWNVSDYDSEIKLTYTPGIMHKITEIKFASGVVSVNRPSEAYIKGRVPEFPLMWGPSDESLTIPADIKHGESIVLEYKGDLLPGDGTETKGLTGDLSLTVTSTLHPSASNLIASIKPYADNAEEGHPWAGNNFGFSFELIDPATSNYDYDVRYTNAALRKEIVGGFVAIGKSTASVIGDSGEKQWVPNLETVLDVDGRVRAITYEKAMEYTANPKYSVFEVSRPATLVDEIPSFRNSTLITKKDSRIQLEDRNAFYGWIAIEDPVTEATFCVKQSESAFSKPSWYAPVSEIAGTPYFYLFRTPYGATWINEVNLYEKEPQDSNLKRPYVELVWPKIELDPGEFSFFGWALMAYGSDGGATQLPLRGSINLVEGPKTTSAYSVYTRSLSDFTMRTGVNYAFVLIRPCGTSEGGVLTGISDRSIDVNEFPGNLPLDIPNIHKGVSDSTTQDGSVTLASQSEKPSERILWKFLTQTPGEAKPDTLPGDPEWSKVTLTSRLINANFPTASSGKQRWGGGDVADSDTSWVTGSLDESQAPDLYNGSRITIKPNLGYHFVSMTMPKTLRDIVTFDVDDEPGELPVWMSENLDSGLLTFDKDLMDELNKVYVTITIESPLKEAAQIETTLSEGLISADDWVTYMSLYDVEKPLDLTTVKPYPDDDNGWLYQPIVGDKVGTVATIHNELVNEGLLPGQSNMIYLAWSYVPAASFKNRPIDPLVATKWSTQAWILGSEHLASPGISIGQLKTRLAKPSPVNDLHTMGGLIELIEITDEVKEAQKETAGNFDTRFRIYRTPNDQTINCLVTDGFKAGAIVRFALIYGDPSGEGRGPGDDAKAYWQSMSPFEPMGASSDDETTDDSQSDKEDVEKDQPRPYCPWYVPEERVNMNDVMNPPNTDVGETPYFWLYGMEPGSVWINEFEPFYEATASKKNTFLELAMKAVEQPEGASMINWSIEAWSATYPGGLWDPTVVFTQQTSVRVLDKDWGGLSIHDSVDPTKGLSFYALTESIENIRNDQYKKEFAQTYDGALVDQVVSSNGVTVYQLRLIRDNGATEDEVLFSDKDILLNNTDFRSKLIDSLISQGLVSGGRIRAVQGTLGSRSGVQLLNRRPELPEDSVEDPLWWHVSSSLSTFPGANVDGKDSVNQPELSVSTKHARLLAYVLGGRGDVYGDKLGMICEVGENYSLLFMPKPWYEVGALFCNNQDVEQGKMSVISVQSFGSFSGSSSSLRERTEVQVKGIMTEDKSYTVNFVLQPTARDMIRDGAFDPDNDLLMSWLTGFSLADVATTAKHDTISLQSKYWLGISPEQVTPVDLRVTQLLTLEGKPAVSVSFTTGAGVQVSHLVGDGHLVLQGKQSLTDPWTSIDVLSPSSADGKKIIQIEGDYSFFRVVLISRTAYEQSSIVK